MFCGHPSLRFGDVVHFVELWGSNPLHTIIFTEPDFPYLSALTPFQPLAMKAVYCPIETSLNFQQANKLIKELKPGYLVIPESYTQPPVIVPHKMDLVIDQFSDKHIITFKSGDIIKLPIKRSKNKVYLAPDIAKTIFTEEIKNASVSTFTGVLNVKDNLHNIHKYIDDDKKRVPRKEQMLSNVKYEWGTIDVGMLCKKLNQSGIVDLKIEQSQPLKTVIDIPSENSQIVIDNQSTHILCGGKQSLRMKLRNIVLQCIQSF